MTCCMRVKFYFSSVDVETFFVFDKYFRVLCFIKWVILFTCKFCFVVEFSWLKTCQFIFYIMNVFEISALFARWVYLFVWN